jgi:hypothetical protein
MIRGFPERKNGSSPLARWRLSEESFELAPKPQAANVPEMRQIFRTFLLQ